MGDEKCYGMYDKWPDVLEVWRKDESDIGHLKFVLLRKNNRMLQTDQMALLRELETHGLEVVVRVGTIELSLDQFEKGLGFIGTTQNRMLAQSTLYNKRSELKRFDLILEQMPSTDPRRDSVIQRVAALREQLGMNEPTVDPSKLEESGIRLENLVTRTTPDPRTLSGEQLLVEFPDLKLLGLSFKGHAGVDDLANSSEWSEILSRRSKAFNERQLKEKTHAEQPTFVPESEPTTKAGE
jgi:hypothetical protein